MVKNAKILTTSFVMVLITACSTTGLYTKMSEEEMIRLAKVDSLYTKISKIIALDGQEISKEDAINLSPADYYGERFIDPVTDSIVVKIRKVRKSDTKLKQKIGFYSYYGKYADTITSKMMIDCAKTDSLLLAIYNKDQENRSDDKELNAAIDAKNQQVLFNIIEQCGFPDSVKNKKESAFYAFIILLHSDGFFKKKYFEEIKKAVRRGDLDKRHLAYFKDKMAVSNEKKQRYGTQMAFDDDGNMILAPVDNIKKVNKRRKKIGLPPVE